MYTDILILAILKDEPQHGYEIKKSIERILGGSIAMNNKVLYPALRRFVEMGALQRTVQRQEGKPDRHVYNLTEYGQEVLQALLHEFTPELAVSDAEFYTRMAFFPLLEPEARLKILRIREDIVARKFMHLRAMSTLTGEREAMSYARRVLQFQEQQAHHEIDWLRTLIEEIQALIERPHS